MTPEQVFLTDARRTALNNYDKNDSNHRTHKSRTKARAKAALDELLWVAGNSNIENEDVFPPETIRNLLITLLVGSGGLKGGDPDVPDSAAAYTPPEEYSNAIFRVIESAQIESTD